jgi:two-component system, OmpR family, sensor kinase
MTVKRRITWLVAGAGFVASLLFSLAVFLELVEQPFQLLDAELEGEARRAVKVVATRLSNAASPHDQPGSDAIYEFWIKVFDRGSGKLFYQSQSAESVDLALIKPGHGTTVEVSLPSGASASEQDRRHKTTFRVKAFSFNIDGNGFIVQIARPMDKLREEIWELVFSLVAGLILSGLVLIAISHFVAGKILQPIGEMKAMAKDISEKNLDQRLPVGQGNDEFNALAGTINRMLDRLQHSFENQRNFLFDTSHELKTPLTTMRLAIDEVCASGIEPLSAPVRENLLRLNEQVRRMDRLVKDLLNLSALEMTDAIEQTPLLLATIIAPLVDEYRFLAEAQNIHIDCCLPELGEIRGDAGKLTRAFSNIMDNGIKYNQAGGTISVEGAQADGMLTISFTNSGPGVSEVDIGKVFDQFFRAEKSRSIEHGGSGLGLAIVKRIITLHGGNVWMESRPGEWTRVWVTLPAHQNAVLS